MAGELFFLDEIVKAGDPWHGLYRASDNKIHTPHGVDVPLRGEAPEMEGSCYKVAIPGTPGATNTADDIAAGRTWLNYAIVAGYNNRLYGKPMFGPVYIDDGNKPWRVVASPWVTWSGLTGTIHLELAFLPLFGGTVQQTITKTLSFTVLSTESAGAHTRLEDVAENCRRFLISHVGFLSADSYARRCMALGEVVLNGVPPAVTATFTKVADEAATNSNSTAASITTENIYLGSGGGTDAKDVFGPGQEITSRPEYGSNVFSFVYGSVSYQSVTLIGGRYSGNAPQPVIFRSLASNTASGSADYVDFSATWSGQATGVYTASIEAGGAAFASYSFTRTVTGGYDGSGSGSLSDSLGRSASQGSADPWGGLPGSYPIMVSSGGTMHGVRYSNTVYGVSGPDFVANAQAPVPAKYLVSNVGGRIGSHAGWYSVTDLAQAPMYASEHPVTGQIERSTTLVCWV